MLASFPKTDFTGVESLVGIVSTVISLLRIIEAVLDIVSWDIMLCNGLSFEELFEIGLGGVVTLVGTFRVGSGDITLALVLGLHSFM